jgi:serralysin
VDANNDGIIGTPFSTIESRGSTTLLRRPSDDQAFVQVGTGPRTQVTTPWGAAIGTNSSTWQIIAADTIAGVNQVLLRNNVGNFLHTWTHDSNWSWTASNGTISPTSTQGLALLNQFGLS